MPDRPNPFASGSLDRVSRLRRDDDWLRRALGLESSRVAIVWRSRNLVVSETSEVALLPVDHPWLEGRLADHDELVLLGVERDRAVFAADLSSHDDPLEPLGLDDAAFADLRQIAGVAESSQAALCAYARAITTWHRNHRHCGRCGAPTASREAGHLRRCTNDGCGVEVFPRTDPAVIMLVEHGDRCLLGRQARWPPGTYSTLAGFVEPGESLEDAVRREVLEETGIEVGACRYSSSQPWPFPSSIMLGFHAEARTTEIELSDDELEDARWFSRDAILQREVRLPPRLSIARRLIEDWTAR